MTFFRQYTLLLSLGAIAAILFLQPLPCLPSSAPKDMVWNTFLGTENGDWSSHLRLDAAGNIYLAGVINESGTWNTGIEQDIFVAKLTSDGTLVWQTTMGGLGIDQVKGIAVSGTGNIYVTGDSQSPWGAPLNERGGIIFDVFLAKLSPDGSVLWNTFVGAEVTGGGVAVDQNENIYVTGQSSSSWGTPINDYSGSFPSFYPDGFVIQFNDQGVPQWHTFFGGTEGLDNPSAIAIDSENNAVVTGSSTASWGNPVNQHSDGDNKDIFVCKINNNGTRVWNTFLGSSGSDSAAATATEANGIIYVSGTSEAGWGIPVDAYSGDRDGYVAKLSGSGVLQWNTFFSTGASSAQNLYFSDIAIAPAGDILVGGSSQVSWGEPAAPHTGDGNFDGFIAAVASSGRVQWNTFVGTSDKDFINALGVDNKGKLFVGGSSENGWGVPINLYSGDNDAFVARFDIQDEIPSSPLNTMSTIVPVIHLLLRNFAE